MLVPRKRSRQPVKSDAARASNKRRAGRPMKRASELAPSRKSLSEQSQQIKTRQLAKLAKNKASLSALERLPVEIIQHIFFDSLEVNLARTSPLLTKVLSHETIYNILLLFAYFDDDLEHPVETQHFRPALYRPVPLRDKIRLQQGILSCRWCTLERVTACMPILSRLKMVQVWYAEREVWQKTEEERRHSLHHLEVTNSAPHSLEALPSLDDIEAMERRFGAKSALPLLTHEMEDAKPTTDHECLPCVFTRAYCSDDEDYRHRLAHSFVSTVCVHVIPDWLLVGNPWTHEKRSFLQLLRQGFRFLHDEKVLSISAQALFQGMASAIEDGNLEILKILLELHYAVMKLDFSQLDFDLHVPSNRPHKFTDPVTHPLPLSLFHLAAKQGQSSSSLLELLIREDVEAITSDDPVLTSWAVRAKSDGDTLGDWILAFMEGPSFTDKLGVSALFVNGAIEWRRNQYYFRFPYETFTQQIGYAAVPFEAIPTNPEGGPCG